MSSFFEPGGGYCGRYHMHPEDQGAAIVFGALGMIFGIIGGIAGLAALVIVMS